MQKEKSFKNLAFDKKQNTDSSIQWNLFYFKDYKVRWKMLIRLSFHNDFSLLLNL